MNERVINFIEAQRRGALEVQKQRLIEVVSRLDPGQEITYKYRSYKQAGFNVSHNGTYVRVTHEDYRRMIEGLVEFFGLKPDIVKTAERQSPNNQTVYFFRSTQEPSLCLKQTTAMLRDNEFAVEYKFLREQTRRTGSGEYGKIIQYPARKRFRLLK